MSFIKHSIIVFLLLNVVRESFCDEEVDNSMVSIMEEQPDLGQSDIDLPTLHAARDADGNINIGKENRIAGKSNSIQGTGNSVMGSNNVVRGNNNVVTGNRNRVTGNRNLVHGNGLTVRGNGLTIIN